MTVREIRKEELNALLALYTHLHEPFVPEQTPVLLDAWARILADPWHHILVAEEEGALVSSCVCVIVPNLTRGGRPYALVENVVTRADRRGHGLATACLAHARALAAQAGCYKIMLLTGAKDAATLRFYERAGFSRGEKTGFVQRLP